jgi:hypothetical protein
VAGWLGAGLYPLPADDARNRGFRYLNSGTYMGDRDALLHMLGFFDRSWHGKCLNALGQVRGWLLPAATPSSPE